MLSLAFALVATFGAPQSFPDVVRAYHGDRLELVFTRPMVVTAKLPCEWVGPRLDGTTVKVCSGSVVAVALGTDVRTVR